MNERRCESCGEIIDAVRLQYQPLTKTCTHACSKSRAAKKRVANAVAWNRKHRERKKATEA